MDPKSWTFTKIVFIAHMLPLTAHCSCLSVPLYWVVAMCGSGVMVALAMFSMGHVYRHNLACNLHLGR